MLWPALLSDTTLSQTTIPHTFTGKCVDGPYIFSIGLNEADQTVRSYLDNVIYDFQIDDPIQNISLQLTYRSGFISEINGLSINYKVINKERINFSELGQKLICIPRFGLIPISLGDKPGYGMNTVIQKARISIQVFADSFIFWFDDFNATFTINISDEIDFFVDKSGLLAGFIFRNKTSKFILNNVCQGS